MKAIIKKFIPSFLLRWYHFLLALLGAILYCFPSRPRQGSGGQAKKLKIIGVTGTNGKTTTTEMIAKILEEAGYKTALMNSIRFKIGEKEWLNTLKMTMPGRFKIQQFLRKALNEDCQYAILEVTSEGIRQYRHKYIYFDIAVFTNLNPEHIEAHGSFEKYRAAKGKLFGTTKEIHIINIDDKNSKYFLKFPSRQKFFYSTNESLDIKSLEIDWKLEIKNWEFIKATNIKVSKNGISFEVDNRLLSMKLLGDFNVYNALAAICVGVSQGISLKICQKALENIEGISGRMEMVVSRPFQVFVDYAVTPDALEKVYQTFTEKLINREAGKLICVLGACGGGRDKWKRPVLGEIAARYCNQIIITNEDPYDEDPKEIIEAVASGAFKEIRVNSRNYSRKSSSIYKILDRRKAIRKALKLAKPNDIVIITGKGCEPWICVGGGKKIPWDDRKVVREEFSKLIL